MCRHLPPLFAQRIRDWVYPIDRACKDDYEFMVHAQTGSLFTSRTSEFHAYPFSVHGYNDWRLWAIAIALAAPGDTIVEIGANIGTETIGFSDIVGDSGRVFTFEPLPSNLAALKSTLSLSHSTNVTVFPFAVGDECKKVSFVTQPKSAPGIGHILGHEERTASIIEVECVTLDSLSDLLSPIKIIFSDTEGAELMVLRGAKSCITKNKPTIVVEANPVFLDRAGFSLQELYNHLAKLDYEIFRISRFGLTQVELRHFEGAHNWICLHRAGDIKAAERSIRRCGLFPCISGLNPLTNRSR